MSADVKILDGNTFVVSDSSGDIEASMTDPTGLFSFDTRFLSKWILTVDGERLNPLSVDDLQYFETRFFLVPGTGTVYVDAKLSVIRQRAVGGGFHEELTILNHDDKAVDLAVRIEAGNDFADLFEVKDALEEEGRVLPSHRRRPSDAGLRARDLRPRDLDLGDGGVPHRRARAQLRRSYRAARANGRPTCTWSSAGRPRRPRRAVQGRARRKEGQAEHGARSRPMARRGAFAALRLGPAQGHLSAEPGRSGRTALLAARHGGPQPARSRAAVVHDDVRPGQHLHQPAGAAVHARAGRDHPHGAGHLAGHARRRLPRRGPRPHPA